MWLSPGVVIDPDEDLKKGTTLQGFFFFADQWADEPVLAHPDKLLLITDFKGARFRLRACSSLKRPIFHGVSPEVQVQLQSFFLRCTNSRTITQPA